MSYITNEDCFVEFDNIDDKTVDLVLVDLPYGQTACKWDVKIDLRLMWKQLKRICKRKTVYMCSLPLQNSDMNLYILILNGSDMILYGRSQTVLVSCLLIKCHLDNMR